MCTAITWLNKDFYFGRNMDIGYSFNEEVVITPRNYVLTYKKEEKMSTHYAMIGMAYVTSDYPLYAEAMNEKGLCIAGLNFPGYAHYHEAIKEGALNLTPYEIIPYFLGKCKSVDEVIEHTKKLHIVAILFQPTLPLATLHWMVSDKDKSIVIESTKEGLKIHENPVGVMTNNPTFDWHLTNLSNYLSCDSKDKTNTITNLMDVQPLGHGVGGLGLPGDSSTTSRFIRAVFVKSHSKCSPVESSNLSQFFHILDNVAVARGAAQLQTGGYDYTTYTSCMNATKLIYYYRTYFNSQICGVKLDEVHLDKNHLISFELVNTQQVYFHKK